jgi:cell division protease FtsH
MGHAIVGLRLENIDPVHKVTIIPRGYGALGITMTRPLEDRYILTEPELLDRLAFALGGRTAEEIMFKEISTGAADDLQKATEIARAMVVEYGMSPKLGPMSFSQDGRRNGGGGFFFPGQQPEMSEETARVVDEESARLMNEAHERARVILTKDRRLLGRLSKVLVEREAIDGKELRSYLDGEQAIPTDDDLKREADQKAAGNGHKDTEKVKPGPSIRASAPTKSTEEIPVRPDAAI